MLMASALYDCLSGCRWWRSGEVDYFAGNNTQLCEICSTIKVNFWARRSFRDLEGIYVHHLEEKSATPE